MTTDPKPAAVDDQDMRDWEQQIARQSEPLSYNEELILRLIAAVKEARANAQSWKEQYSIMWDQRDELGRKLAEIRAVANDQKRVMRVDPWDVGRPWLIGELRRLHEVIGE